MCHHQRIEHLDSQDNGVGCTEKVYVLDGNVPILVNRTTMDETLDVEAKSHVEMFHHYLYICFPSE